MSRSKFLDFFSFDLKIERTLKNLRKQKRISSSTTMAKPLVENKVLRDYAMPSIDGATLSRLAI